MSKVVVKGLDIPVDQMKPSPYQPRLTFGLEDIRESIKRDGILVTLTVRKKDGFYELIDGERRWRLAKELGYETVPCDIIDVDDETARGMVWKVNSLRKEYTTKEKAYYFKTLKDEYKLSVRQIAIECGYKSPSFIVDTLRVFDLPKEYQQKVWDEEIFVSHLRELSRLYKDFVRARTEVIEWLDRIIDEGLNQRQLVKLVEEALGKIEEKKLELIKELLPEPKLETSEELEKAAKALRKKAKELKTPEQILKEKQEKVRSVLLTGKGSVTSKIEKAKELGIDTKWMEEETEKIKNKMSFYPGDALLDSKGLKTRVNELIKRFQDKKRRAEIRKSVEKEFEAEKVEEIKGELRKDEVFKAELRTELVKEMVSPSRIETLPVEIPEEEAGILRERIEKQRQKMMRWMLDPEIQKRGKLFKNWVAHGAVLDVIGSMFCPKHPEKSTWKDLKWSCCGLSVDEAYEMLRKKLEKGEAKIDRT